MEQENIVDVKNQDQSDKAKNGNNFNKFVQSEIEKVIENFKFLSLKDYDIIDLKREFNMWSDFCKAFDEEISVPNGDNFRLDSSIILVDKKNEQLLVIHIDNTTSVRIDRIMAKSKGCYNGNHCEDMMWDYIYTHHNQYSSYKKEMCFGVLFPDRISEKVKDEDKEEATIESTIRDFRSNRKYLRKGAEDGVRFMDFCMRLTEFLMIIENWVECVSTGEFVDFKYDLLFEKHKEMFNVDTHLSLAAEIKEKFDSDTLDNYTKHELLFKIDTCGDNYTYSDYRAMAYILGYDWVNVPRSRVEAKKKLLKLVEDMGKYKCVGF